MNMPAGPTNPRELGKYVAMAQVGMEMAAPVAVGALLDHYFGWSPWGIVGGAIFGLVAGMGHLFMLANRNDNMNGSEPGRNAK